MNSEQALEYADTLKISKERYRFFGDYFGYPDCCIENFIQNSGTPHWFEKLNYWDPDYFRSITDGYIPCEKCYNKPHKKLIHEINSKRKAEDKLGWTSLITP